MDTIWLQKRIWSFTAVDFLDFDFFPVECSQLKVKHPSGGQIWHLNVGMFRRNR